MHELNLSFNGTYLRKLLILMIISGIYFSTRGQTFSIRVNSGINFYDMTQMKELQNDIIPAYPEIKTLTDFPPYYNFQLQTAYIISPIYTAGIYVDYLSTGGRQDYADYSGEIRLDQLLSRISAGLLFESTAFDAGSFSFILSLKTSYQITKLKLKNMFRIFNDIRNNSTDYSSSGFGIEPGFAVGYSFFNFFLRLEAGYQFSVWGAFTSKNGVKLPPVNYPNEEIKPQWNGFKIALTLGINI